MVISVEHDALNRLIEYDWPGNEDQLERVLERASFLSEDGTIRERHLHFDELDSYARNSPILQLADKSLCEIENYFISWQLRKHNGNKSKAARSLGITDRTIFNRVRKYGLE